MSHPELENNITLTILYTKRACSIDEAHTLLPCQCCQYSLKYSSLGNAPEKLIQSCTLLGFTSLWLRLTTFCCTSDVHDLYFCRNARSCNGRYSLLYLLHHVFVALCLAAMTQQRSVWPPPERSPGLLEVRDCASAGSATQKSSGADCALWSPGNSPKPRSVSRCLINSSCSSRSAASLTLPGLPWPVDKYVISSSSLPGSQRAQTPTCGRLMMKTSGPHHQT